MGYAPCPAKVVWSSSPLLHCHAPMSHLQVERLRVKLQEVEEWLQAPGCELRLGQPPAMGDESRGDGLSTQHLLQGMRQPHLGWGAESLVSPLQGCWVL